MPDSEATLESSSSGRELAGLSSAPGMGGGSSGVGEAGGLGWATGRVIWTEAVTDWERSGGCGSSGGGLASEEAAEEGEPSCCPLGRSWVPMKLGSGDEGDGLLSHRVRGRLGGRLLHRLEALEGREELGLRRLVALLVEGGLDRCAGGLLEAFRGLELGLDGREWGLRCHGRLGALAVVEGGGGRVDGRRGAAVLVFLSSVGGDGELAKGGL